MTKEEISEFDINHSEMTVNQRIKLQLKDGNDMYGFFKVHAESESFETLRQKNKWEFIILPQESFPPKVTTIDGDEILSLEIADTTVINN